MFFFGLLVDTLLSAVEPFSDIAEEDTSVTLVFDAPVVA